MSNALLCVNDNGNVGIGTNSPTAKLQVAGDVNIGETLNVGTTTPSYNTNYGTGDLNVENDLFASAQIFTHNDTAGNFSFLGLGKSSGTGASPTVVQANERIAVLGFYGYDGAAYKRLASIDAYVDGTPGTNDMPGKLLFNTTSDGSSSPTTRLTIGADGNATFTGNVGIGTTSPSKKLHVVSAAEAALFQGTATWGTAIQIDSTATGGRNFQIQSSADAAGEGGGKFLIVDRDATGVPTRLSIDSTGNVGIGTASPSALLNLKATTAGQGILINGNQGYDFFKVYDGGGSDSGILDLSSLGIVKLKLHSKGDSYFNGGNVGIGTTANINAPLTIQSNSSANAINLIGRSNGVYDESIISFYDFDGTSRKGYILNSAGNMFFSTGNGSENMTILSDGNVGIGTTSPSEKLEVMGGLVVNSGFNTGVSSLYLSHTGTQAQHKAGIFTTYTAGYGRSSSIQFALNSEMNGNIVTTSDAKMTILEGGNVGIGTTSPGKKLHVVESGTNNTAIFENSGQTYSSTAIKVSEAVNNRAILSFAVGDALASTDIQAEIAGVVVNDGGTLKGDLTFKTNVGDNLQERMRIDSSGNVGIGTTSPSAGRKLDVHGDIELTEDLFIGATSSSRSEHKIKIGQNRSGNGYAYIDMIGDAGATSFYNLRIIRHNTGANALSQIVHTGTGNFEIKASDGGDIILNSSGNVGISNTSPTHKLDVTGDARFTSTVTATNFILSSDERLKENVEKVCDNRVKADWKTFELKTDKGQKRYGVIAQELEKTNPEFVREDSQGFKSVAYIDLLIAKIAELEARLEKLEK